MPTRLHPPEPSGFDKHVDMGRRTVAVLGKNLHQDVVQIAQAKAEHRKIDPIAAAGLDHPLQILVAGRPEVEIAIGRQAFALRTYGFSLV
ncbi:hypothetical protein ABID21_004139 [Pseudorhizobium tarimense]|uniref:Uncharacterized protein n=1 Tax=Pseudorhizobium tarimense TaxID=1079109 RepID=A0ABV2HBS9_9HYPH|nr:hypothetical protein [Pseudorhizobium tarimense]MCJ8521084.1 hypothetical protein [Pseudorhizobium tarimense]